MAKSILIDASRENETRVALLDGEHIEEFGLETRAKSRIVGNVYLAKVVRVEAALQAVFVEYGGDRHGFLPFAEIHPDYFVIPIGDREEDIPDEPEEDPSEDVDMSDIPGMEMADAADDPAPDSGVGEDDREEEADPPRVRRRRRYKVQEVIRSSQLLLVQVSKDERGKKGAALTTYISLAGRYCVLMPNSRRSSGGVSNKITNKADRKRLKDVAEELEIPPSAGLIFRTAGARRTKAEIKTDFEYLVGQWNRIKRLTLDSIAPALIHTEAGIIKRTIRDLYSSAVEAVQVDGANGFKVASEFMASIIPDDAHKVTLHEGPMRLFEERKLEASLDDLLKPTIGLPSGGYIVIGITEALTAVDVNSGRSVQQGTLEDTALQTNLEAAREVARQLRLRQLAGLVVIDFVDMDKSEHNRQVEKTLKECVKQDRARIQIGRISQFGLIEMTRQRMRPSLHEMVAMPCPTCHGGGWVRSPHSAALQMLNRVETEVRNSDVQDVQVKVSPDLAATLINEFRGLVDDLEARLAITLRVDVQLGFSIAQFELVEQPPPLPRRGGGPRRHRSGGRHADDRSTETRSSRAGGQQRPSQPSRTGDETDEPSADGNTTNRRPRRRRGTRRRTVSTAAREDGAMAAPAEGDAAARQETI